MLVKVIHICQDEKFINSAIQQFESCFPNSNTFYIFKQRGKTDFKHVKPQKCVQECTAETLLNIANVIEKDVIVVLHSLCPLFYEFVLQLPKENKIVWFCFGFEVYKDVNYFKTHNLLDAVTRDKFPEVKVSRKKKVKEQLRPYYRLLKPTLPLSPIEYKKEVMRRINFLGSSFHEEFQLICKLIKQKKDFFAFWYYPLELILNISVPVNKTKKTILIGNSGTISGNHLDVFTKLRGYNLIAEKIVVPLNYGESKYISTVVEEGKNDFSNQFIPLLEFMPLHEYNTILEEVGVAIFNNRRQQAIGNTIALLWNGAKVFLSKQNPFYGYLKRIGVYIYCFETDFNEQSCNQLLSAIEIEHNRSVLFGFLNREKLVVELQEQIFKINAK